MKSHRRIVPEPRLRGLVAPLLDELGKANAERLRNVLPLFANGEAKLSQCLKALFPRMATSTATDRLRVFRKAVNDAAVECGVALQFS